MKNCIITLCVCTLLVGCSVKSAEFENIKNERDELKAKTTSDSMLICRMRDTISMLAIPVDQRMAKVNRLINDGDFKGARNEMVAITSLFPESKEATSADAVFSRIDDLMAKKKAEEERVKSLGFKALKPISKVSVVYNEVAFTGLSTGKTFSYDSYSYEYHYSTADRGNVFVTAAMSVTSTSKDPQIPTLAVYSIVGDRMKLEGTMRIRFAKWEDYGTYLGNYHDNGNDFSKTSTVKFKLGVEVPEDVTKKAYAVVLKKENCYSRHQDRFDNPPVSYSGSADYPNILKLEDFTREGSKYVVIKLANL